MEVKFLSSLHLSVVLGRTSQFFSFHIFKLRHCPHPFPPRPARSHSTLSSLNQVNSGAPTLLPVITSPVRAGGHPLPTAVYSVCPH